MVSNFILIEKFKLISSKSQSNDPELNSCLAIMNFINRDFQQALHHFEKALEHDPENYSIWNKIGATYAYLKMPEKAQMCYYKSLTYKPNYVRGWANLAINHKILNNHKDATGMFLNALSLNPQARHIWTYLESIFIDTKDDANLFKMSNKDINRFSDMHNIKSYSELPQPENTSYIKSFENYLLKDDIDAWVAQSRNEETIKEAK